MSYAEVGHAAFDTIGVQVAAGALLEMGYATAASHVHANKIGVPSLHGDHRSGTPVSVIVKAFYLGHQAMGHDVRMSRGLNPDFEWEDSLDCTTCAARLASQAARSET